MNYNLVSNQEYLLYNSKVTKTFRKCHVQQFLVSWFGACLYIKINMFPSYQLNVTHPGEFSNHIISLNVAEKQMIKILDFSFDPHDLF